MWSIPLMIAYMSFALHLDLGRVLAGIQVPPAHVQLFDNFLHKLGYPYVEETDNVVYRRFLRS